jgi:hypothetical protein
VVLYSCVKKTTYPTTPEIEFKDFFPFEGDSAYLQIKFKDGDGDIGVSQSDSTKTLFYTYYYKDTVTNQYRAYYSALFNDTLRTGYVVKTPTEDYNGKPISGDINISLQQYRHSKKVKRIKYVIYMLDRAGNKSNIITTPELIAP